MIKTQILINKRLYLGLSTLDLSKILIYKILYDYVKPRYGENAKLCYMNTDSFIVHLKADDIYKDIEEDIGARFEIDRLFHKEKIYDWTNKR